MAIFLRYQPTSTGAFYPSIDYKSPDAVQAQTTSIIHVIKHLFNLNRIKYPNQVTSSITNWSTYIFSVIAVIFCAIIIHYGHHLLNNDLNYVIPFSFSVIGIVIVMGIIARQPMSDFEVDFKVPLVPLLPCLSIIMNVYLMLELDLHTWVRFVVWLALGKYLTSCIPSFHI